MIKLTMLNHPGTLRPLEPKYKEAWLLLQITSNFGIIYMVLGLYVCSMQELSYQGSFHTDFRRLGVQQCA